MQAQDCNQTWYITTARLHCPKSVGHFCCTCVELVSSLCHEHKKIFPNHTWHTSRRMGFSLLVSPFIAIPYQHKHISSVKVIASQRVLTPSFSQTCPCLRASLVCLHPAQASCPLGCWWGRGCVLSHSPCAADMLSRFPPFASWNVGQVCLRPGNPLVFL